MLTLHAMKVAKGIRAMPALLLLTPFAANAAEVPVILDHELIQPSDPGTRIRAVAIDGNTIVLGAPFQSGPATEAGAAYVFERPPGGHWVQTARLQPSQPRPCLHFGRALEVRNNTIVANHWDAFAWYNCIGLDPDPLTSGLYAFNRGPGGWSPIPTGKEALSTLGWDLAFDGTSAVTVSQWDEPTFVLTHPGRDGWTGAFTRLEGAGNRWQWVDLHDGLLAISGSYFETYRDDEDNAQSRELATATLYQRDASDRWSHVTDIHSRVAGPAIVEVGLQRRIAIGVHIYEPDASGNYVLTANLAPPCLGFDYLDLEFDRKSEAAVVRSRPTVQAIGSDPSLIDRGTRLHLFRRLQTGEWVLAAQLIASDNSPANVNNNFEIYEKSFAIDSDVVISNKRLWDANGPKAASYQFSNVDQCAGHRGNWIELTPQRWAINNVGGVRAYTITTSAFGNLSGDRLGEYSLLTSYDSGANFDLSMKARSNEDLAANPAADYAILLGYRDEMNYSYIMFNRYAANNEMFKVENGVRRRIARATRGSFVDNGWHKIEIRKRGEQITVLFDGRVHLTATDDSFTRGGMGIGSYNDAASFDDIVVREVAR